MNFKNIAIMACLAVSCSTVLGAPQRRNIGQRNVAQRNVVQRAATVTVRRNIQMAPTYVRALRPALRAVNNRPQYNPAVRAAVLGAARLAQTRAQQARVLQARRQARGAQRQPAYRQPQPRYNVNQRAVQPPQRQPVRAARQPVRPAVAPRAPQVQPMPHYNRGGAPSTKSTVSPGTKCKTTG